MKKALVTRSDKFLEEMAEITHPLFKNYAQRHDCDFIVLDEDPIVWTNDNRPHYRILECRKLLNEYDRLLILDTDMLILPNCPNIFDEVPYDKIGSIYEDKGTRAAERREWIKKIQDAWGDIGWESGYTNAGTFVVSKIHQPIFNDNYTKYWVGNGSVDLHLSYMARARGFKIHELSYKWNHMTMFSEEWNGCADRFDSNIIHYAGRGLFDKEIADRISQIKKDYDKICLKK